MARLTPAQIFHSSFYKFSCNFWLLYIFQKWELEWAASRYYYFIWLALYALLQLQRFLRLNGEASGCKFKASAAAASSTSFDDLWSGNSADSVIVIWNDHRYRLGQCLSQPSLQLGYVFSFFNSIVPWVQLYVHYIWDTRHVLATPKFFKTMLFC